LLANILAIIRQAGILLLDLLPYVLIGCIIGAVLIKYKKYFPLKHLLVLPGWLVVILFAVLGCVSPLCTLGTVPMVIGFVACGLPFSAAVAFIVTSSLLTPQMIILASTTIGLQLTIIQVASGLAMGITAGFIVMLLRKLNISLFNIKTSKDNKYCASKKQRNVFEIFIGQLEHIILFVVAGAVIASIMNIYIPKSLVFNILSENNPLFITGSALASVPGYTCGGGIFPVLGTLLEKGISPGIVLTFVLSGPATRLQAITAVGSVFSKAALIVYIGFILISSILVGTFIGALF